ncbi:hypothetical protein OTU49_009433 [Cherax quadricarinatus]|uniref:Peptidyl-prolyl cis-trans isomerase n=1 Tax=Cherax quadricarinatus TaxID=27406 RepID=A0AAW0YIW3_CHEQU
MSIPDKSWQPPYVVLETSMGEVTLELYWKHAPNTCRNFAELSRRGYYNGCKFHRIIRDFMIQGRVSSGMQVVKRMGLVETDNNDRPVDPVKIKRAYVKMH